LEDRSQQQLNPSEYLRILYRGRWIIFICTAVLIVFAVYYNITTTPSYEASALIMLKKDGGIQKAIFENPILYQN
jgi:uncharacterized protein involved in exopolysaccharide biosynthesis